MVSFLKSKPAIVFIVFLCLALLYQFNSFHKEKIEPTKNGSSCSIKEPLNPNGDSELALLMREMYDTSVSLKTSITKAILPRDFPQRFRSIHSAKPTDPTVKTETFKILADEYLKGLKALSNSKKGELKTNYNESVQKCINCHEAFCPGPIKKIVKLKFTEI